MQNHFLSWGWQMDPVKQIHIAFNRITTTLPENLFFYQRYNTSKIYVFVHSFYSWWYVWLNFDQLIKSLIFFRNNFRIRFWLFSTFLWIFLLEFVIPELIYPEILQKIFKINWINHSEMKSQTDDRIHSSKENRIPLSIVMNI